MSMIMPTNISQLSGLKQSDISAFVKADLNDWARESALIDSFILFNFIPCIYATDHDLTKTDLNNIQRLYEMKYSTNDEEKKYFQQIGEHLDKYNVLMVKMFQIFALSNERKLTNDEQLKVFHHFITQNDKSFVQRLTLQ